MADIVNDFEAVLTTYFEVKEQHPEWSDVAVEDYMARLRDSVLIGETANAIINNVDIIEQVADLIPITPNRVFYSTIKDSNYTAISGDFVEARCRCIITLDSNADQDAEIIIANGDGTRVTVLGNIKYTRTTDRMFISNQGTSLHFQMFVDGNTKYWRIR
jgi:hypothetical protein